MGCHDLLSYMEKYPVKVIVSCLLLFYLKRGGLTPLIYIHAYAQTPHHYTVSHTAQPLGYLTLPLDGYL